MPGDTSFPVRIRDPREVRARMPAEAFPPPRGAAALRSALDAGDTGRSRAIYVHVPFCRARCRFCAFLSEADAPPERRAAFLDAIESQVARHGATPWGRARPFEAVFLGGGTPLQAGIEGIGRILGAVRRTLTLSDGCEVTVELRCEEATSQTLAGLRALGVNRVSLGVQTFDSAVRQSLGRALRGDEVVERLRTARGAGFRSVVADLLYPLPGQTPESWANDLELLGRLDPGGCSLYPLAVRPGTGVEAASMEREQVFHDLADRVLVGGLGWRPLTPVQYAAPGRDRAVYVTSWANGWDVLAAGPGAGGRIGRLEYRLAPGLDAWVQDQDAPVDAGTTAALAGLSFPGPSPLRLAEGDGIGEADFAAAHPGLGALARMLVEDGLAVRAGGRLALTRAGRFWAGNVYASIAGVLTSDR
jgi:oxygen-independent coproporphyrinogen-3 oxidase